MSDIAVDAGIEVGGHDFATISAGRDDQRTVLGRWCLRCGKDDVRSDR